MSNKNNPFETIDKAFEEAARSALSIDYSDNSFLDEIIKSSHNNRMLNDIEQAVLFKFPQIKDLHIERGEDWNMILSFQGDERLKDEVSEFLNSFKKKK